MSATADIAAISDGGANTALKVRMALASVLAEASATDHAELHTVASHSDTTATGAQLNTLVGAGDASALHNHTTANLNDTTATGANLNTLIGGGNADSLHVHATAAGADSTAIHDDTAAEISAITEKTAPVSADLLLIEDSAAANAKKKVQIGNLPHSTEIGVACSDETTAITATGTKATFRMPHAMTLTGVRASLTGACATGTFTVDINEATVSVLSTKITIDATEKTSTTAVTAAVISDSALADDASITIDVDNVGDSTATGLKIWLLGTRA